MNHEDALNALNKLILNVTGKAVSLTPETDLKQSEILDSVDALVFFMELENSLGVRIPENADLKTEGYYSVKKLLSLLDETKN